MNTSNTREVAFWNGPGGERWVRDQEARDALVAPYGEAALRAAAPAAGESVLDVGCGCGTTLLALSDRVGARGRIVGIDVSAPMLSRARELVQGRANVAIIEGDAASAPLEEGAFDLLFSRFGVMFFDDRAHAFKQLAKAIRPGGRLAFVCWRALVDNPWAKLPLDAASRVVGPPAAPVDTTATPGPFAFANDERVKSILAGAGFVSIAVTPFDAPVSYVATLEDAAARLTSIGPAARLLADCDAATTARVVALVREAIAPFGGTQGVRVPAATWIVTARAPKRAS